MRAKHCCDIFPAAVTRRSEARIGRLGTVIIENFTAQTVASLNLPDIISWRQFESWNSQFQWTRRRVIDGHDSRHDSLHEPISIPCSLHPFSLQPATPRRQSVAPLNFPSAFQRIQPPAVFVLHLPRQLMQTGSCLGSFPFSQLSRRSCLPK